MIPTVVLATLQRGDANRTLTLPGSIQPYYRASTYARVNGYLKSWDKDIGAHVKADEVLASIEVPDLDQQLAQAKATLVSAKANHDIAVITANRNDVLVKKQIVAQQIGDQTAADATEASRDGCQRGKRSAARSDAILQADRRPVRQHCDGPATPILARSSIPAAPGRHCLRFPTCTGCALTSGSRRPTRRRCIPA